MAYKENRHWNEYFDKVKAKRVRHHKSIKYRVYDSPMQAFKKGVKPGAEFQLRTRGEDPFPDVIIFVIMPDHPIKPTGINGTFKASELRAIEVYWLMNDTVTEEGLPF
jgi:hypothetical protein